MIKVILKIFFRHLYSLLSPVLVFTCTAVLCLLFSVSSAFSEQRELKTDSTEKVDAILLLDTSGSMLVNDPQRLRDEGARLFIQFLKPGDQLAIIDFSEQAKIIRPLSAFEPNKADEISAQISSMPSEGEYTDILSAIQLARKVLEEGRSDARPVVVLLSDGKMDPNPSIHSIQDATQSLLNDQLPEMKSKGQHVYSLAMSKDADKDLLQQIASATDGRMWYTPEADKIHESYADLFLAVKKPQVIPLSAKGFAIDSGVDEATFYINRSGAEEVQIISPSNVTITATNTPEGIKWFKGAKFDVVTIVKPEVGSWKIVGLSSEDGFATILTNLKLITDWPTTLSVDEKQVLQARLYESEKPVALPEMAGVVRFAFQITPTDKIAEPIVREFLVDDGTKGDKIAGDGIFSFAVSISEPGDYRIRIIANAPTFERQLQIPFRVRPPLLQLSVVQGDTAAHGEHADVHAEGQDSQEHNEHTKKPAEANKGNEIVHGDENAIFRVEVSEELRNLKNVQVQLTALDENRGRYVLPIQKVGEAGRYWDSSAKVLPKDGQFKLKATLTAEGVKKAKVNEESLSVTYERKSSGEDTGPALTVVVEHPEEAKDAGFPWIGLLIITVLNGAAAGFAFSQLSRLQGSGQKEQKIEPLPADILKAVNDLETRAAAPEVDLNALIAEIEKDGPEPEESAPAPSPEPTPSAEEAAPAE